ncbi:MAG TPA: CHAT domain-containing protein [Allosphingosinicella sp.]
MIGFRAGLLALGLLPFFCFAGAQPAAASATTDLLCHSQETGAGRSAAPDQALIAAAAAVEQRLIQERGQGSRLDAALAALEVPVASGARPSPAALARYCTAAGEVMRLSVEGSQLQAQNYLLTALRESQSGGLPQITSQAAYRLGLVSLQGPPVGGARSGGTAIRRSGSAVAQQVRSAQIADASGQVCSALADTSLDSGSNAFLSALALDCAARLALDSGDPALSALASLRLARFGLAWSDSASDPEELRRLALNSAINALPTAATVSDPRMRAELIGRLLGTVLDLGGSDPAIAPALAALRQSAGTDPAAAAMAASLEGRLALRSGDRDRARALIEAAILSESQRALPMRLPDYYLLLAEADPAQRERHVYAAYNALDNMRPLLPRNDPLTEESVFTLHMRRVFESAVEVQLAGADTGDARPRIRMAQQIVEAYRQAELLNAVGSECLPPRNPVRPEDLGPREVLLYPLLLQDRLELLYVVGSASGGSEFRRLPPNRSVDRREITRLVEDLVLSMSGGQDEAWREPAQRLYALMIQPIEHELQPGTTLAIIPDGALRALPFAALVDGNGRFLVQRTAISVAPALAYSQPGPTDNDGHISVVAASLQREVDLPAGYFGALQGTEGEARIAAENGAPGVLIQDFRRQDLVSALSQQPVDVLHLATHASFNGRSDRAFIVANGEAIRLSELREMIERNRTRGDSLDLLVLSACETAVGDDEASMGLAGAAVQAGALAAIASLWQVNDLGTAELMRQFYRRYRTGLGRSQSLRDAQLALIEQGGDNARPNIWAAFTLVGAWR